MIWYEDKDFRSFFIKMCDIEGVSPKELQEITGKSKSVVYEWLDYSKPSSLPTKETLLKVLARLGLTMDNYINCESEKLAGDSSNVLYRTYHEYMNNVLMDISLIKICNVKNVIKKKLVCIFAMLA